MKVFIICFSLFISSNLKSSVKVCSLMQKATNYNSYVLRMEQVFSLALNRNHYTIKNFRFDRSKKKLLEQLKKIKEKKCKILFGGVNSRNAIFIANFLKGQNTLFITPTASSIQIKKIYKNTIYMSLNDLETAKVMSEKLVKNTNSEDGHIIFRNLSYPNTNLISTLIYKKLVQAGKRVRITDYTKNGRIETKKVHESEKHLIVMSYEQDLIKIHNQIKKTQDKLFYGADGWGTNSSIYRKFVRNDKNFNAIRLNYWNRKVCNKKNIKKQCLHIEKITGHKLDAYMAIAYDSAIYLNNLKEKTKKPFMTQSKKRTGHFYSISSQGIKYQEDHERIK